MKFVKKIRQSFFQIFRKKNALEPPKPPSNSKLGQITAKKMRKNMGS